MFNILFCISTNTILCFYKRDIVHKIFQLQTKYISIKTKNYYDYYVNNIVYNIFSYFLSNFFTI